MAYGDILIADRVGNHRNLIYRYNGTSWDSGFDGPHSPGTPGVPSTWPAAIEGLAVSPVNGDVFVTTSGTVYLFKASNSTWYQLTGSSDPPVSYLEGIAFDTNGELLVTSNQNDKIYRYSNSSWDSGLALPSGATWPRGLTVDPSNRDILVVDRTTGKIYRYNGTSWDSGIALPTIGQSRDPFGLAVDTNGNILLLLKYTLSNTLQAKIYRYNGSSWSLGPSIPATLDIPYRALAVDGYIPSEPVSASFPGTSVSYTINLTKHSLIKSLSAAFNSLAVTSYTAQATKTTVGTKALTLSLAGIVGSYTPTVTKTTVSTKALTLSSPGISGNYTIALSNEPQNLKTVSVTLPGIEGSFYTILWGSSSVPVTLMAEFSGVQAGYRGDLNKLELVSWFPAHAENNVPLMSDMNIFANATILCTHATLWTDDVLQGGLEGGELLAQAEVVTTREALKLGEWYTFETRTLDFYQVSDTGGRTSMARRALHGKIGEGFYIQLHDGDPGTEGTANIIQQLSRIYVDRESMTVY